MTHPSDSGDSKGGANKKDGGWKETDHGDGTQTMKFGDDDDENNSNNSGGGGGRRGNSNTDLFELALNRQASFGPSSTGHRSAVAQYRVLQVDERVLLSLSPSEVFVVKYPSPLVRNKYFKNMIPEIKIHLSPHCRRFFHEEDFEFEYLKAGHCPCCRVQEMAVLNDNNNSSSEDS